MHEISSPSGSLWFSEHPDMTKRSVCWVIRLTDNFSDDLSALSITDAPLTNRSFIAFPGNRLASEIGEFCSLEEKVHSLDEVTVDVFQLETSSFLRECGYERVSGAADKMTLLKRVVYIPKPT